MNKVVHVQKINAAEAASGSGRSWHDDYSHSAYIFVGGLDNRLTEGDVIAVFSQYGEPVDINLARDKDSGTRKGFCFIAYEDQRSTRLAIDNLNGVKLLGRTLSVDHCADYKPPESDSDGEGPSGVGGIAPVAVSTSDEEEPDSVDLYLDQSKKKKDKKDKKEKKAKKKEKKEKKAKKKEAKAAKEHRRSPSGTPSADEEDAHGVDVDMGAAAVGDADEASSPKPASRRDPDARSSRDRSPIRGSNAAGPAARDRGHHDREGGVRGDPPRDRHLDSRSSDRDRDRDSSQRRRDDRYDSSRGNRDRDRDYRDSDRSRDDHHRRDRERSDHDRRR